MAIAGHQLDTTCEGGAASGRLELCKVLFYLYSLYSQHLRMSSPYQPVFTDGWAPSITEPELIGIVNSTSESENESDEQLQMRSHGMAPSNSKRDPRADFPRSAHYEDSDDYEENNIESRMASAQHRGMCTE